MILLPALLLSCRHDTVAPPDPTRDALWPFPNGWLMRDGHLDLPEGALPMVEGGTPIDVARLNSRTGFSPVQTTVFDLGVALDPGALPYGDAAVPGEGPVQIWDLDAGRPVRGFGELDAGASDEELPTLLVRPLEPMIPGHEIAVVLTGALLDASGQAVASPDWFVAAAAGRAGAHLSAEAASTPALLSRLDALGVTDPILAISFPIDAGGAALDQMMGDVGVPEAWIWDAVLDADEGADVPDLAWKQLEGHFQADQWITDAGTLEVVDGLPVYQGLGEADLLVHIPTSARDAAPGTVPVWLFGHGIFGDPGVYLSDPTDPSAVLAVADAAGAILIATPWTGLTRSDLGTVFSVANDFGTITRVTDPLAQALANQRALIRLALEGDLLDDPLFEGLPDRDHLFYYGISLGGIEGAVLLSHEDRLEHAVLHAGGSTWSMMLERSYAWQTLEPLVADTIPAAADRQLLYALSQLFWDPVDPATVAESLGDRSILWQECLGDDMVPNLSTDVLVRGVGAALLDPAIEAPAGLDEVQGPVGGPVLFQFDPELGRPERTNRPSDRTEAHNVPRIWPTTIAQTVRFLDATDPGVAAAACGDEPCTASNQP